MLITISLATGNKGRNENSSSIPSSFLSGRTQHYESFVLDVWLLPGGQMTFSTGHVRLWEKEVLGHKNQGKTLPLGKMPNISKVHCKAVKFLISENPVIRTQIMAQESE